MLMAFVAVLLLQPAAGPENVRSRVLAPRQATPEETEQYLQKLARSKQWADMIKVRRGLKTAQCSIGVGPRSSCRFEQDGIGLTVSKEGLARAKDMKAFPSFGHHFRVGGNRLHPIDADWIKIGDVFELIVGDRLLRYKCVAQGEADWGIAQCDPEEKSLDISSLMGTALARSKKVEIRHNGDRVKTWTSLAAAAYAFAQDDFSSFVRP